MDNITYATNNLLEPLTRNEYIQYATNNPYAEVNQEHFFDVSKLARKLWEQRHATPCPEALVIAGLYHDIDRVFPAEHSNDPSIKTSRRAIDTKSLPDEGYTENQIKFVIHPQNCAAIFREYNPELPESLKNDVAYLIERHELGAAKTSDGMLEQKDAYTTTYNLNDAADVLCEADGTSFFSVIIYSYLKGKSETRAREKIKMSYRKLSREGKEMVRTFEYRTADAGELVRSTIVDEK